MSETLHFILRCKSGTEKTTLRDAAEICGSAWLPMAFESHRTGRGAGRRDVSVRMTPIMPYLFLEASHDAFLRISDHKHTFGAAWFLTMPRQREDIALYRRQVEAVAISNFNKWRIDARAFHCNFKKGQTVNLHKNGMDLMPAVFDGMCDDGRYSLSVEMMGQAVKVLAEPHHVAAE